MIENSRFFMDHGAIHDRATGKHVGQLNEPNWRENLFDLLRSLEREAETWARECRIREIQIDKLKENLRAERTAHE